MVDNIPFVDQASPWSTYELLPKSHSRGGMNSRPYEGQGVIIHRAGFILKGFTLKAFSLAIEFDNSLIIYFPDLDFSVTYERTLEKLYWRLNTCPVDEKLRDDIDVEFIPPQGITFSIDP
jgi:hypothetical protein